MGELVQYSARKGVATVMLNRPEKRNALNGEMVTALKQAFARAAEEESVRVIVLEGAGKVFSAGADLAALETLQSATPMENTADSEHLASLFEQMYVHPKPIIARVHGHAIAGGCGLAAVCDFSIVASHAKLGFTEVRIGFVPAIVMVFMLRKLGEASARDLLLRGRLISAERAAEIGLVTQTVPAEALDETVDKLAWEIATQTSGSAVALTKNMLAQVPGMGLSEALAYATQLNAFARGTADCRAGISAFLKKVDPPWKAGS
ncbi:MAG: enoyl-CoA hydratase/isomerase family protein [Rhodothermales bacterium]